MIESAELRAWAPVSTLASACAHVTSPYTATGALNGARFTPKITMRPRDASERKLPAGPVIDCSSVAIVSRTHAIAPALVDRRGEK